MSSIGSSLDMPYPGCADAHPIPAFHDGIQASGSVLASGHRRGGLQVGLLEPPFRSSRLHPSDNVFNPLIPSPSHHCIHRKRPPSCQRPTVCAISRLAFCILTATLANQSHPCQTTYPPKWVTKTPFTWPSSPSRRSAMRVRFSTSSRVVRRRANMCCCFQRWLRT